MALFHCLLLLFVSVDLDGGCSSLFGDLLPPLDILEDLREGSWIVEEFLDLPRSCLELSGREDVSTLAVLVERIQLDVHGLEDLIFGLQFSGIMNS